MTENHDKLVISQKKLTLLLGALAVALPGILYLGNLWVYGNERLLPSLSSYYYTGMRDFLVGILFSMGMFLITYEGFGPDDRVLASFGGLLAILVAVIPTHPLDVDPTFISDLHNFAAAGFYSILTYFCLRRFTITGEKPTFRKKIRNIIYYVCGGIMIIVLFTMFVKTLFHLRFSIPNSVFWLEYMANVAFGIAFIVYSEGVFFLNDDPILEMKPWEIFGFTIVSILILMNFIVLTNIWIL